MGKVKTSPLQNKIILESQASGCPKDVLSEIEKLWLDKGLGNDYYYYKWYGEPEQFEEYPIIGKYLEDNDVGECLIRYWW